MGAMNNYTVLTRYECVVPAYESGLSIPFIKVKNLILEVESEYKNKHEKSVLNIADKRNISNQINYRLFNKDQTVAFPKTFKVKPIRSATTIKKLLTASITELDAHIDWDNIDWENHDTVLQTLSTVIEFVENS